MTAGGQQEPATGLGMPARLVLAVLFGVGLLVTAVDPFSVVFFGSYALAGGLLVIRRPRNSIGWVLLLVAVGFVGTTGRGGLDLEALVGGTASTIEFLVAWFGAWAGGLTMVAFLALTILFPSGRLPSGPGRRLAVAALVVASAAVAVMAVAPTFTYNPDGGANEYTVPNRLAIAPGLTAWDAALGANALLVPIALVAAGVVAMLIRSRRSVGVERLQMRWLVAAMTAIVGGLLFGLGSIAVVGEDVAGYVWIPAIVAYPSLPAAIYVAISRYRLYEIDRIVSRTLAYALVTAVLAVAFVGTNLALQALIADTIGGSTFTVAASTLVVAAVFQPLRRRIQAPIDRRFNRARADAEQVVGAFSARARDEVDLTRLGEAVVATAGDVVRPTGAALWLRGPV